MIVIKDKVKKNVVRKERFVLQGYCNKLQTSIFRDTATVRQYSIKMVIALAPTLELMRILRRCYISVSSEYRKFIA